MKLASPVEYPAGCRQLFSVEMGRDRGRVSTPVLIHALVKHLAGIRELLDVLIGLVACRSSETGSARLARRVGESSQPASLGGPMWGLMDDASGGAMRGQHATIALVDDRIVDSDLVDQLSVGSGQGQPA